MIPTLLSLLALSASGTAIDTHAPHYSLYLYDDVSFGQWPSADKVQPYNRLLLAFLESSGATASSSSWASFSDDQRQSILNDYHNNGIAVMVSAFGAADSVISKKKDPVKTAQEIAGWANQHNVDGVDVDLEDFESLENDKNYALDWLTKFYNELSNQLGGKPISSTPTAWMYGSKFGSADSVYCKLNSAVGDKISWYNMQLYNGAQGTWNNCPNTVQHSDNGEFLALNDISNMCGIPMNKLAVGKLWDSGQLAHANTEDQIIAPAELGQCLASSGTGGVMVWSANIGQWDQPLNYLKDTLGASSKPAAVSSEAPASSAAPAGNNLAAAPAPSSSTAVAGSASSAALSDTAAAPPSSAAGPDSTSSGSVASSGGASPPLAVGSTSSNEASSNVGGVSSASSASVALSSGSAAASAAAGTSSGASSSDGPSIKSSTSSPSSSGSSDLANPKAASSGSAAAEASPKAGEAGASGSAANVNSSALSSHRISAFAALGAAVMATLV